MTVIGFNLTLIKAERKGPIEGKISIQNGVKVDDVTESQLVVGDKKMKTLIFHFSYSSIYAPNTGSIEMKGNLVYMTDPKKTDEVMKQWKGKEKKVPEAVMAPVINMVLNKCSIMALQMSKEVSLPPQIALPKVKVD